MIRSAALQVGHHGCKTQMDEFVDDSDLHEELMIARHTGLLLGLLASRA